MANRAAVSSRKAARELIRLITICKLFSTRWWNFLSSRYFSKSRYFFCATSPSFSCSRASISQSGFPDIHFFVNDGLFYRHGNPLASSGATRSAARPSTRATTVRLRRRRQSKSHGPGPTLWAKGTSAPTPFSRFSECSLRPSGVHERETPRRRTCPSSRESRVLPGMCSQSVRRCQKG
jgi:hypothetical protein